MLYNSKQNVSAGEMQQKCASEVEFIIFLEDVPDSMELIIITNKNLLVYNSKAGLFIAMPC